MPMARDCWVGADAASISRNDAPWRASSAASTRPVGPAPTTSMSISAEIIASTGASRSTRGVRRRCRRYNWAGGPLHATLASQAPRSDDGRQIERRKNPGGALSWCGTTARRPPVNNLLEKPLTALQDFLRLESASGIILIAAAGAALACANSPAAPWYDGLFALELPLPGHMSLLHAINDGLMTLFFLL